VLLCKHASWCMCASKRVYACAFKCDYMHIRMKFSWLTCTVQACASQSPEIHLTPTNLMLLTFFPPPISQHKLNLNPCSCAPPLHVNLSFLS